MSKTKGCLSECRSVSPARIKGDPLPGRRGYARPEGIFFLGNRVQDQKELWLKAKDILTHCLLFGTTGSGKTETLVSLSYNALATGSGLFYIDPKASPETRRTDMADGPLSGTGTTTSAC